MNPRSARIIHAYGTPVAMMPRFHLQVRGAGNYDAMTAATPHILHMESAMTAEVAEWCDLLPRMQRLGGEGWNTLTPHIPSCEIIGVIRDVHVIVYLHGVRRDAVTTFFVYRYFHENVHIYTGQRLMGQLGLQIRFRTPGRPLMMIY